MRKTLIFAALFGALVVAVGYPPQAAATNPQMAQQQKMMQIMLPLMFPLMERLAERNAEIRDTEKREVTVSVIAEMHTLSPEVDATLR